MDESRNPYNRWFRRIKTSHAMTRSEIVDCCRIGGLEITSSMADAWSRAAGGDRRRAAPMTEAQFEAFTAGLVDWIREARD